jgi:hypothetical protein
MCPVRGSAVDSKFRFCQAGGLNVAPFGASARQESSVTIHRSNVKTAQSVSAGIASTEGLVSSPSS